MRLWDHAQTIFRSGKLHISYAKAEIGPKKPEIGAKKVQTNDKIGTKINRKLYYMYYIRIMNILCIMNIYYMKNINEIQQ